MERPGGRLLRSLHGTPREASTPFFTVLELVVTRVILQTFFGATKTPSGRLLLKNLAISSLLWNLLRFGAANSWSVLLSLLAVDQLTFKEKLFKYS